MTDIGVGLLCATVGVVLWRLEPLVRRMVEVAERRNPVPTELAGEPIPADLLMAANAYADRWARDDALKTVGELYAQLKDWNAVRVAFAAQNREVV